MKTKRFLLAALLCLPFGLNAQNPNFSEDIAPILYQNCAKCHHSGGIAPFPLITYNDAYTNRYPIQYAVSNGIMPPWPPDTTYQRYIHERVLTQTEINAIITWVNNGAPQVDSTLAPHPPVFNDGAMLGPPDLKLTIPVYTSKASGVDDYVCFVLPTGLTQTRWLRAIEVVPGDRSIVHHCLVFIDSLGTFQTDTVGSDCGGPPGGALVTAYVPGAQPLMFPNGSQVRMGMRVPAGSNIVLNMHYPDGSAGKKDSTSVNLYFYPPGTTGIRQVKARSVLENWNFCIPPNTYDTVTATFPPGTATMQGNYSVLSVFPHMHLLGKEIESWAIGPAGDTIPFVRINNWQFDWQDFYFFRYIKKLSIGTKLYARGVYNNTVNNPLNPNNPPQTVCAGLGTADEMFLVYFHYLKYKPGDELINLDSLMTIPVGSETQPETIAELRVWPNPFSDNLTLACFMPQAGPVRLSLFSLQGQEVAVLAARQAGGGWNTLHWRTLPGSLPPGVYLLAGNLGPYPVSEKVIYLR